jgi:hypothetical protein
MTEHMTRPKKVNVNVNFTLESPHSLSGGHTGIAVLFL